MSTLNLDNIQGDILSGLPKKTQLYIFFEIVNVKHFRHQLVSFIPLIKTVAGVIKDRKTIDEHKKNKCPGLVKLVGVNISFSHKGFEKMGINDSSLATTGPEDPFILGQKQDAFATEPGLGDPKSADGKTLDWDPHFLRDIHGVILISGDSHGTTDKKKIEIDKIFKSSIKEIITIRGDVRPGAESAHEHFGFQDGISNPAVIGFDPVVQPGTPSPVQPGVIITGKTGDPGLSIRKDDDWSTEGSFAVFRYLFQKVPEFNVFLKNNPLPKDGNGKVLSPKEGSDLLGARMVGRWKSGAPIDLTPFHDDPALTQSNNFKFAGQRTSSLRCPFAAHIRKTNPRDDLEAPPKSISVQHRRIARRGIQFGPELTAAENASGKTMHGRGLLFQCYQTSISNGFRFHQDSWANNANFHPFTDSPKPPGLDPLIGQGTRSMIGLDPNDPLKSTDMGVFIIPRGGEYFFSPSISGLKSTIAQV